MRTALTYISHYSDIKKKKNVSMRYINRRNRGLNIIIKHKLSINLLEQFMSISNSLSMHYFNGTDSTTATISALTSATKLSK